MLRLVPIALATAGLAALAGCTGGPPPLPEKPFRVVVIGPRGELVSGPTVKVYGYVEGGEASMVKVGPSAAQLGLGGSFEATVPCGPDGLQLHTVVARPRDGGAPVEAEVAWTTDNTKPEVRVTAPAELAEAVTRDALRVEGTVTDISPVRLAVDGQPLALDGARFEFTRMLAEGENAVTLVATDAAGHVTEVRLTLRKDTAPPVCEIEAIPAKVREHRFALRGRTGEPGCRVFVNGEEAAVEGEAFHHELPLSAGDNPFDVVVRDGAGHQATAAGTVVMEPREPPTRAVLLARLQQELTESGGGWYVDQFKDLQEYGREAWAPLLALAEETALGERQNPRVATQAMEALTQLGVTDAITLFEKLADGANPGLSNEAIWMLERLGKPQRATQRIELLRRQIEDDVNRGPDLWREIGDAHARMNHFAESLQAYLKAIDAARVLGQGDTPALGGTWYNLACQHCKLNDVAAALEAYDTSRKLGRQDLAWAAKDGDLRLIRGEERFLRYFWESGDGGQVGMRATDVARTHPASGLLIVERARDRLARDPTLLVFLAVMYQINDREADATKTLEEVVAIVPNLNWGNVARQPQWQALHANARFKELVGASGGAGEPGPGPGGAAPGGEAGAEAPAGGPSAALRQLVQSNRAPARIVIPAGAKAGQYAQWTTGQGRKIWWGLTASLPEGGWLVEQRRETASGWLLQAFAVDGQGAVRQAGAADFDPATGQAGPVLQLQVGSGAIQGPDPAAPLGEGAETLTAAGREWSCIVRNRETQGRTVREWLNAEVPVLGVVKQEVDGKPSMQLESVGDDAKPGVPLGPPAQRGGGGGGGDF